MTTTTNAPQGTPAASSIHNLASLFRLGRFTPASVQRGYEWGPPEARQLLGDIEKVYSRLYPDPDEPADAEDEEEDEDAASSHFDDDLFFQRLNELVAQTNSLARNNLDELQLAQAPGRPVDPSLLAHLDEAATDATVGIDPQGSYFIGNIILADQGGGEIEIFDGLQRITTLTILFAVLRDMSDDEALAEELDQLINRGDGPCLRSSDLHKSFEEYILPAGATLQKRNLRGRLQAVTRQVLRVKNSLIDMIETWPPQKLPGFTRFLLSQVWLSALDVPDIRMARQMFVSTNRHGKKLDLIDLLRAQLAEAYGRLPQTDAEQEFAAKWTLINEYAGHRLEDYLRAFDMIERRERQFGSWPTDFAAYVVETYGGPRLRKFVNRLVAHAWAWERLRNSLYHGGREDIEQDIWRLDVFRWPQWQGLALRWWGQYSYELQQGEPDEKRLKKLKSKIARLHKRCMALTLARLSENDLEKIFNKALDEDIRGVDVYKRSLLPNARQRKQIDKTLRTQIREREIWWPLMRWLEISRWRNNLPRLIRDSNTEHVLPRRPDLDSLDAADLVRYENACYSLGNLAVISKPGHERVTNEPFLEKLPVFREEAKKFRTMHSIAFDENGIERRSWDDARIFSRAERLRLETWQLMGLKAPAASDQEAGDGMPEKPLLKKKKRRKRGRRFKPSNRGMI